MSHQVWEQLPSKEKVIQLLENGKSVRVGYFTENPNDFSEEHLMQSIDDLRLEYEREIRQSIRVFEKVVKRNELFWAISARFKRDDALHEQAPIMNPFLTFVEAFFAAKKQGYKYFWWNGNLYSGERLSNVPVVEPAKYIVVFKELPEWMTTDGA